MATNRVFADLNIHPGRDHRQSTARRRRPISLGFALQLFIALMKARAKVAIRSLRHHCRMSQQCRSTREARRPTMTAPRMDLAGISPGRGGPLNSRRALGTQPRSVVPPKPCPICGGSRGIFPHKPKLNLYLLEPSTFGSVVHW